MMFLKIGDVILNSDKIVSVEDDGRNLYVFTVVSSAHPTESKPYYLIPAGSKADALRRWLDDFAIDLMEVDEDAKEQELVEASNGAPGIEYHIHYTTNPFHYDEDDSELPYIG